MEIDKKDPKYQIDVEQTLRTYYPTFFNLLGKNNISWASITKAYQTVLIERAGKFETPESTIIVEPNFLDMVTRAMRGDLKYHAHISFLNHLIQTLSKWLSEDERTVLSGTIYNLLVQPDLRYLNFIGELATLWKFKKLGYTLHKVEIPVNPEKPKSTKIDFVFLKDEKLYYVEVKSLHPPDDFKDYSDERMVLHLSQKITKYKSTISEHQFAWLFPIVWTDYETLKRIYSLIKQGKLNFEKVFELNAYVTWQGEGYKGGFQFGNITTVIDNPLPEPF